MGGTYLVVLGDAMHQLAAGRELGDEDERVVRLERLVQVDDVRVLDFLHDVDLNVDVFDHVCAQLCFVDDLCSGGR